jgi:hypothetical protein
MYTRVAPFLFPPRLMPIKLSLACACVVLGLGYATAQPAATAADTSVTAIDILLLPDATMIQHAEAVNKRLRSVFPKGFSMGWGCRALSSSRPRIDQAAIRLDCRRGPAHGEDRNVGGVCHHARKSGHQTHGFESEAVSLTAALVPQNC